MSPNDNSDCEYQAIGKKDRKRDGIGSCSTDRPNVVELVPPFGIDNIDIVGGTEADRAAVMARLLMSDLLEDNPCDETRVALCCLGPRDPEDVMTVYQCNFFDGIASCMRNMRAQIFCCLGVEFTALEPWGLTGRVCY